MIIISTVTEYERFLQHALMTDIPGPNHHPWARCRWRRLGLGTARFRLTNESIYIQPHEHVAVNLEVGNGSPDEYVAWLKKDLVDLSSLPCRVLFSGLVTPDEAIRIFREKYSTAINDTARSIFARHPYYFPTRWGSGIALKINRAHIEFLYGILPENVRVKTPLDWWSREINQARVLAA